MKYALEKPVITTIGMDRYKCTVQWRNGVFIADEPLLTGGKDLGPDPQTLLLSSLASCTLATLRMYTDRKGWDIPEMSVSANLYHEIKGEKNITVIDRNLTFISPVSIEQRERLIQIAKVCPVSKMLEGDIEVHTFVLDKDGAPGNE